LEPLFHILYNRGQIKFEPDLTNKNRRKSNHSSTFRAFGYLSDSLRASKSGRGCGAALMASAILSTCVYSAPKSAWVPVQIFAEKVWCIKHWGAIKKIPTRRRTSHHSDAIGAGKISRMGFGNGT
jgi:hypothetical protein